MSTQKPSGRTVTPATPGPLESAPPKPRSARENLKSKSHAPLSSVLSITGLFPGGSEMLRIVAVNASIVVFLHV